MSKAQPVVVIGAGVIGLATAWHLAERGAAVTVVEARQPGSGTSGTSFAWLNASSKVDAIPDYFELNARALRAHAALASRPGALRWARFTGDVEVAPSAEAAAALARKVERLAALGYAAELLLAARLDALEPSTVVPAGGAAAYYAQEGWADVGALVSYLLMLCRGAGAVIVAGDPAEEIILRQGRAAGVKLASGVTVAADVVVTALGRWTPTFAAALGVAIPLVSPEPAGSRALGLLVRVAMTGGTPRRLLHSPAVNWSPRADGGALLASDAGDMVVAHDRTPAAAEAAAAELVRRAAALNPIFAGAAVDETRIGIRALPADHVTICGWVDEVSGLYVAVTHSGVTLAPYLGRLVAEEVAGQADAPILRQLRPSRFRAAA